MEWGGQITILLSIFTELCRYIIRDTLRQLEKERMRVKKKSKEDKESE